MRKRHPGSFASGIGSVAARDINAPITIENHLRDPQSDANWAAGLSVRPPYGLLPAVVRGRNSLIKEESARIAGSGGSRTAKKRILLLHGLPGVGKSATALAIAERVERRGVQVFWIDATARESVQASMWRIAMELAAPSVELPGSPNQVGAIDTVWRILDESARPWLIIFDNADDPSQLAASSQELDAGNGWLRSSRSGFAVVTSRSTLSAAWDQTIETRQLKPISHIAGGQVLCDMVGPRNKSGAIGSRYEAEELAKRLGCLPLALRAAGKHLAMAMPGHDSPKTFAEYRGALDGKFSEIIDKSNLGNPMIPHDAVDPRNLVTATWGISFDLLEGRGFPEARAFMQLLACYASAPIPLDLLNLSPERISAGRIHRTSSLQASKIFDIPRDFEKMRRMVEAVAAAGLIEVSPDTDPGPSRKAGQVAIHSISLHPLAREVMLAELLRGEAGADSARTLTVLSLMHTVEAFQGGSSEFEWRMMRGAEPHIRHIAELVLRSSELKRTREVRLLCTSLAKALSGNRPAMATETLLLYHDLFISVLGPRSKAVRSFRHSVGHQLWYLERYDAACLEFKESADLAVRILWRIAPDATRTGQLFGCGLKAKVLDSTISDEQILQANRFARLIPFYGPRLTKARYKVARAIWAHGDLENAESAFRVVLENERRVLGEEHPSTLVTGYDLGVLLRERGALEEAETQLRTVLESERHALGEDHPHTLATGHELAVVLRERGALEEAETRLRTVLDRLHRTLGEDHPRTLATGHELAVVLRERGALEEAETRLRTVLERLHRTLHEDHRHTLATGHELGKVLRERGALEEAETQFRAVLESERRALGEDHPHTLATGHELGMVLLRRGALEQAETHFRTVLEVRLRTLGEEHPYTLVTEHELGVVLRERGALEQAETQVRAVLESERRTLGEDHPHTLATSQLLEMVLRERGALNAETQLRTALETEHRALGEGRPGTA